MIHENGQEGISAEVGVGANEEAREHDLDVEEVDIGEQLGETKPKVGTHPRLRPSYFRRTRSYSRHQQKEQYHAGEWRLPKSGEAPT